MNSPSTTDTFQPWQLFTLAGLLGATGVVFLSPRDQTAGRAAGIILLSLLVFAAAAVGLAALRAFLPLAQKSVDEEPQILGGRTRAALEREKTLVLRSIKELEFDRAMRKISEKDFAEMSARLRARAARLMGQLDAGSVYRTEIERAIEKRLGSAESGGSASLEPSPRRDTPHTCMTCSTTNDPDAKFCKSCGTKLEAA